MKYLADYLRQKINEKGISYRELARRSGSAISSSTVADILKGKNANPTVSIVQALARGLREPEVEVFAAACGIHAPEGWSETKFFELYDAYESLQEERHKKRIAEDINDLLTIINAFPKKNREDDQGGNVRRLR